MSTIAKTTASSNATVCAACGKGGEGLKHCAGCRMVKYCGRECQANDRPRHKQECREAVALFVKNLTRAAELFDEALFQQTPRPADDCPICFLPLDQDMEKTAYQPCCGQKLCAACLFSVGDEQKPLPFCPFCRAPVSCEPNEVMRRLKKRMALGDAGAFNFLACMYQYGILGARKDMGKAMELYTKGIELGSVESHAHMGNVYERGLAGTRDLEKAMYHYQQAVLGGRVLARHNLAVIERNTGNEIRARKHFIIAAKSGCNRSLVEVQNDFLRGLVKGSSTRKTLPIVCVRTRRGKTR